VVATRPGRGAITGLLAALALAACDAGPPPAPPPPEVLIATVVAQDVPVVSEWLGTTAGSVDAAIRAQVSGYLISQVYQEGQVVKQGDLLFRIDRRPFQAALDQARGDLERVQAELQRTRLDVARYTPLVKEGAVSQQEFDNAVQRQRAAEAAQQSARAAMEKARIDLDFTEIRSPVNGIAGVARAQIGDLVGPTDAEPLTNVSQLDPIHVTFQISEQEYLRYADRIAAAVARGSFEGALQLVLADGSVYPHPGRGFPAGLGVDPRTGTITVKGEFPNPGNLLRPGQYSRVRAETETMKGALVVPQRAIQELQGLAQLTLVGAEDKIEVRTVQKGPASRGLQVITRGVSAGERVVVEGFQKVRPGMAVVPKLASAGSGSDAPAPAAPAAESPGTKTGG
jgi:membrane fusion protein (multidrug efflux system)